MNAGDKVGTSFSRRGQVRYIAGPQEQLGAGERTEVNTESNAGSHTASPLLTLSPPFCILSQRGVLVAFNFLTQVSGPWLETHLIPQRSWGSKLVIGLSRLIVDCERGDFTYIV